MGTPAHQKIGLLGGTFNPPHLGHLIMAQDALEHFGLEQVRFIPAYRPPHKDGQPVVSGAHRLAMLQLALAGEPRFTTSAIELDRGGISYTIDTLQAFRQQQPDVDWYFIIGGDSLLELHTWRHIGQLLELCRFVTLVRPGFEAALREADLHLPAPWPARLRADMLRGHAVEIASRDIRARKAGGKSIRYLVPEAVARYIQEQRLYEENNH